MKWFLLFLSKGHGMSDLELELASSSLESLSLVSRGMFLSDCISSSSTFPRLSALSFNCDIDFNSRFEELPVLESLRFSGSCKVR